MITYYLGDQEVNAYARDLASRLNALGADFPSQWFMLGASGEKVAALVLSFLPESRLDSVSVGSVQFDRDNRTVTFSQEIGDVEFGHTPVLLIDSAVHSGKSMLDVTKRLTAAGVRNILTYGLVVKQGANLIPNYFGVLIEDTDRAYFQLDMIPNNRILKKGPFGTLRRLKHEDVELTMAEIAAPFNGLTVGDLVYDQEAKDYQIYIYEESGVPSGFISFMKRGSTLFVDGIAASVNRQGSGLGGALMRWAETWGRASRCAAIELWAYKERLSIYARMGFEVVPGKTLNLGAGSEYVYMRRKLLYNTPDHAALIAG